MKNKRSAKHHGEILEQAVKKSGMTIKSIVTKIGYSRSAYYKHIQDPGLPLGTIEQYGKAIRYDFATELPEIKKLKLAEEPEEYEQPTSIEQAIQQKDHWRNRYYALLEKYQQLLEDKLKK